MSGVTPRLSRFVSVSVSWPDNPVQVRRPEGGTGPSAIKMLLHEDENDFMNSQVLSRCSLSAGGPISVKQFLEVLLTKLVFRHLKIFLAGPRELWGGTE